MEFWGVHSSGAKVLSIVIPLSLRVPCSDAGSSVLGCEGESAGLVLWRTDIVQLWIMLERWHITSMSRSSLTTSFSFSQSFNQPTSMYLFTLRPWAWCLEYRVLVCSGCHNKIPQLRWLKQQKFTLSVLEPGSPNPRFWQGWYLLRPLSLACKWSVYCCALTWLFLYGHTSWCLVCPNFLFL